MSWRPSATLEVLKARAELMRSTRAFFHSRGVMEVDTPLLARGATVDRHIESFMVIGREGSRWLQTSPEFAMKRLLAAGSGPIYQLAHVFRREEAGRQHNPEFTMLEWYRSGWDHHWLMDEVAELLAALGVAGAPERLSYAQAWQRVAGVDPHRATESELAAALASRGIAPPDGPALDRDGWLDLGFGALVCPALGREAPCFVHDFPASQAALARVRPGEPPLAERFELVWKGVELANGFHELTDAAEQEKRFLADRAWRAANQRLAPPHDEALIEALHEGLPASAGVALGFDRLLMLLRGLPDLASAMPFDWDRA